MASPDLTSLVWATAKFTETGAPLTNMTSLLEETGVTCGATFYYRPLAAAAIALNPSGASQGPITKKDVIDVSVTYATTGTSSNAGTSFAERQAVLDKLIPCFRVSQFARAKSRFRDVNASF
jgi:hypothetical protein